MDSQELKERSLSFSNSPTKEAIVGSMPKTFVRIDDDIQPGYEKGVADTVYGTKKIQDSAIFGDLYESLMTGKSSYVTYLNNFILDEKGKPKPEKDIYIPKFVISMVKKIDVPRWFYSEIIFSRLANLMGIPTVYNCAPCATGKTAVDTSEVVSVDFVPNGYRIETFENMGFGSCGPETQIANFIAQIERDMPQIAKIYKLKLTEEKMEKLIKDFCQQYLFRSVLCGDSDCDMNNYAMFYNKENGDFRLTPLFDGEGMFSFSYKNNPEQKYKMEKSIQYLDKLYPDMLRKFVISVNKLRYGKHIKQIMLHTIDMNQRGMMQACYDIVKDNVEFISQQYNLQQSAKAEMI